MIEEEQENLPESGDATSITPKEMAEALDAVKAAAPALAGALDAAHVTPEGLAGSHGRATPDEPDVTEG